MFQNIHVNSVIFHTDITSLFCWVFFHCEKGLNRVFSRQYSAQKTLWQARLKTFFLELVTRGENNNFLTIQLSSFTKGTKFFIYFCYVLNSTLRSTVVFLFSFLLVPFLVLFVIYFQLHSYFFPSMYLFNTFPHKSPAYLHIFFQSPSFIFFFN